MPTRINLLLGLLLIASLLSCGPDTGRGASVVLETVPEPETEGLEPVVQHRLKETLAAIQDPVLASEWSETELGYVYGDLGRLLHAHSIYESARPCYRNARALDPDQYLWPYYLGHVERAADDLDAALSAFKAAQQLEPRNVSILVALAETNRDLGRLDRAEHYGLEALELDSGDPGALLVLAETATLRKDHAGAVERYEAILERQPEATKLHRPLAVAYQTLGEPEKAALHSHLRGDGAVVVRDPALQALQDLRLGARSHFDEGVAAFEQGRFQEAADAFRVAVEAEPGDASFRMNLGSALLRSGALDQATEQYREALRLDPDLAMAHFNLGAVLAQRGDDANAISHYQEALNIDPGYSDARFNLANSLRRLDRQSESLAEYRALVQKNPGNGSYRLGEAVCLVDLRRFAEGRQALKGGLQLLPQDVGLARAGARLLAACPVEEVRDGDQALRLAKKLVSLGRSADNLDTLAMALAELGRYSEAIEAQSAAITQAELDGRLDLLPRLRERMALYEQYQPCRDPGLG